MKVYEMIKELAQYDADMEVEVNAYSDGYTATVEFDEYVSEIDIDDYRKPNGQKIVRILAEVE